MARDIKEIIIHCSDSDREKDNHIEVIKQWHLKRGFNDVGYHYFINKQGHIYPGRSHDDIGAHARGYNTTSLGICLSGKVLFEPKQFKELKKLLIFLMSVYNIPPTEIYAHRKLNSKKTCPNFCLEYFLELWFYDKYTF